MFDQSGFIERETDMVCMWSGRATTNDKSREHIFPECIGGEQLLLRGDVSDEWNHKLSVLDNLLKKGHPHMMYAWQVDPKGKKIKGSSQEKIEKWQRREREKTHISGTEISNNKHTSIRIEGNTTTVLNASFEFNDNFSRAIHKCIANVVCQVEGSLYVRERFPELIDFVLDFNRNPGVSNPLAWSYAVSFAPIFSPLRIRPTTLKLGYMQEEISHVCFAHTSGIWIASTRPNSINQEIIHFFSNSIIKDGLLANLFAQENKNIKDYFGFRIQDKRDYIGDLDFMWVKKHISGIPNPDDAYYLLTKCKLCGQINPTGIYVDKEYILSGNQNSSTVRHPNDWNSYSISDLERIGFEVEKWNPLELQNRINRNGILVPKERDVRKLAIYDCNIFCINCHNIIFSLRKIVLFEFSAILNPIDRVGA